MKQEPGPLPHQQPQQPASSSRVCYLTTTITSSSIFRAVLFDVQHMSRMSQERGRDDWHGSRDDASRSRASDRDDKRRDEERPSRNARGDHDREPRNQARDRRERPDESRIPEINTVRDDEIESLIVGHQLQLRIANEKSGRCVSLIVMHITDV